MTAAQAFGATCAVLIVGSPVAVLCLVAAIYIHEQIEARRYRRSPNVAPQYPEANVERWVS